MHLIMNTQNTSDQSSNSICQELLALLPAYSMGVSTPDEERLVQAMLPFCLEAVDVLAEYQVIGDTLMTIFPSAEEPPSSAALLKRIRLSKTPQPLAQHTIKDIAARDNISIRPIEPQPSVEHYRPLLPQQRSWGWLALATCFLLAFVVTNFYWALQINSLQREQKSLLQILAVRQPETTLTFNMSNHHRALLPADNQAQNSEASFVWNSTDQIGALVVNGLPSLDNSETYQLWLVRDEHSLSLGTFKVDDTGVGVLIFHAAEPIESFSHIGVSVESLDGASNPTTPHLIIGNI